LHIKLQPTHAESIGVLRGGKRAFAPLEIGTKKQLFLENLKSTD